MELRRYLNIIRRRWLLVLVTVLVALVGSYLRLPDTSNYTATATILVGPQQFADSERPVSGDELAGFDRIISTFSRLIVSRPVAEDALARLELDRSADSLSGSARASGVPNTQLLVVNVTDADPTLARDLTNALAESFVDTVRSLEPGVEGAVPFAPVYVFERAQLPTQPASTGATGSVVVAGVFGAVVAAGVALFIEYLDITLKTAVDVERRLELPVLGVIPRDRFTLLPPSRSFSDVSSETA